MGTLGSSLLFTGISLTSKETRIANELLILIEALEHHKRRQASVWLRITTPDYLPVMVERLKILVAIVKGDEDA